MIVQTDEENNEKPTTWYKDMHIILTIILTVLFIVNLYPQSGIVLNTNNLFILAFIVVLVLSHRFREIEIPGFLKLSQTLKSVKEETKELRNILIQIYSSMTSIAQAQAISQSSTTVNVGALGDDARDISARIVAVESPEQTTVEIPQRTDIERILDYFYNRDYVATFSVLRHLLEAELLLLLRNNQITFYRRRGLKSLTDTAYRNEIITSDIFNGIDIVRIVANSFIHPETTEVFYPIEKIEYIVNLGLTVYREINRLNIDILNQLARES